MFEWFLDIYRNQSERSRDIIKSSIGPTVAILLFVLTNIVHMYLAYSRRREEIKITIIGIYREIAENRKYEKKMIERSSIIGKIKLRMGQD